MTIVEIATVYFTIAFCVAVFGATISYTTYEYDSKTGRVAANVALLCLLWPILAVYALVRLIPSLVRHAGWVTR